MNILVFDIETVPDIESGKKLYDMEGLDEKNAAELMFSQRRQETADHSDFLQHCLHQVVAISVVLETPDKISVWSLGDVDSGEDELIRRFFGGIERYSPVLVSWNGSGFDLPVLHYRALLHGIVSQRYWDNGEEDKSFRWNNYLNRYHSRHTDLMDVLSGYTMSARAGLEQIATMLGFPGKMGMKGSMVSDCYYAGEIETIRHYCETDVLNTYLVYLRYELIRGHLTEAAYKDKCKQVRTMLDKEDKPHLKAFLVAWPEE